MTSKPNETNSQTNIDIEVVNRIYGKTESMLDWPLYTPSPNRECLYKVASPSKTPEKIESMLDWPLYTPSPNRECLYKVASPGKTPEKTESPNRECLYKVASPSKTPEKIESMLDWPLYTPSPNRECLYKVASPGKTPEKTESPNRECLYKVASPGKTPEKTHFYLEWPLYTPASRFEDFDPQRKDWQQGKGWKLQWRGATGRLQLTTRKWDMSRLYMFIVFNVSYRLAMIGILNMLYVFWNICIPVIHTSI